MARIRPKDRTSVLEALQGGVTPRQGIQHIQVGRLEETAAIVKDIENIEQGGSAIRIIQASYGSGKALPLHVKVLTEDGWVPMGDIQVGTRVYTRNSKLTKVTAMFDHPGREVCEIQLADGRVLACCSEHLWFIVVDDGDGTDPHEEVLTVDQMLEAGLVNADGSVRYSMPTCSPMLFGKLSVDGPDWIFEDGKMSRSTIRRKGLLDRQLDALGAVLDGTTHEAHLGISEKEKADDLVEVARSLGFVATCAEDGDGIVVRIDRQPAPVPVLSIGKTGRHEDMRCITVADESCSYVIEGYTPTHNTFFLTLTKTVALRRNFVVMSTDFSPDRRLYSSSQKALETYRALIRSMSTMTHPDGGALEELLDALDEKIEVRDSEFLTQTRSLVCGMDAVTVIDKWHQSKHPTTKAEQNAAFHIQDLCLRWFSGEMTIHQRREFGLNSTIGDAQAYDALKLIAHLAHCAGYAGTLVEYDECVNLYKINNSTSRDKNYEQILRIFNECKQGDAKYIGFIFGGTPEFVSDTRRGLFSYEALQTRLMPSRFRDTSKEVDTSGPIIDLAPLSQEDLLVLLGNITNVEAMGKREDWLVTDDDMRRFLQLYFNALGAEYYRTPREIIRSFVSLLAILRDNPEMTVDAALSQVEVKDDRKESGLGAVTRKVVSADADDEEDEYDDDEFGF